MSEALLLLVVLFGWMVIITLVAAVIRICRGRPTPEEVELEELQARYVRDEISRTDYERRRRELTSRQ